MTCHQNHPRDVLEVARGHGNQGRRHTGLGALVPAAGSPGHRIWVQEDGMNSWLQLLLSVSLRQWDSPHGGAVSSPVQRAQCHVPAVGGQSSAPVGPSLTFSSPKGQSIQDSSGGKQGWALPSWRSQSQTRHRIKDSRQSATQSLSTAE